MNLPTPDALQVTLTLLSLVLAAAAIVKIIIPVWRWIGRVGGQVTGALDNLGGREAFIDRATGKPVAAIPPIGERFSSIEDKLDNLANTSNRLDTIDARLAGHELRLDDHDSTLGLLIGDKYERGSEATLRALERTQRGAIDGEGEEIQ